MKKLTMKEVTELAEAVATAIHAVYGTYSGQPCHLRAYGVPRGGIPAALAVANAHGMMELVDDPEQADVFIDDIIDSGATMERLCDEHPGKAFFALIDKTDPKFADWPWVVFPWEGSVENSAEDNISRLLQFIGEDPERGGLIETPHRVAKAWRFWGSGYEQDPAKILKVFTDGAEGYDEMIVVKDIPVYSHCEHHMAPIFGTATIAYIPDGKIVGLSKLSRLTEIFARRLQVQERLTSQIADALNENLTPKGVGVVIRARHMCMESRGICQQGHHTVTSALRGVLKDVPEARAEFMALAGQ